MLKEKIDDYEKKEGETIKLKELVCGLQEDLLYSRMRNHELKEKL